MFYHNNSLVSPLSLGEVNNRLKNWDYKIHCKARKVKIQKPCSNPGVSVSGGNISET